VGGLLFVIALLMAGAMVAAAPPIMDDFTNERRCIEVRLWIAKVMIIGNKMPYVISRNETIANYAERLCRVRGCHARSSLSMTNF